MTKENIYTALMKCEFKKVKVEGNNAMFNAKYMKVKDIIPMIEVELQKQNIICIGTMR
jgi:hypothetical protein